VFDYELNLKHISGYSIPVLYNASVYKDDEGEIIGVFAAARDITTIRKAEDELIYLKNNLESANKELEAFSYSVSHDLKAPLRHITGYISLLVKKYIDLLPEEGRHYLDNISYSAKNMGELIDGLLQFSKTGRIDMNQRLLDINGIVDTLIQPIKEEDTEHRIELNINPLPLAFGDFNMIKSVWSNLIENAVKFTKNKDLAKITIGAEENEKDTIYYIKDNGAGFDMNYATKLFAVFQRLHSREDYDGTGIGLATVQRIITRHGGKTWAEGKVGEGATFYFSLIKRKESE
jgi:light-regulated signal transduction histidine kinase (bacteriophytochrome)